MRKLVLFDVDGTLLFTAGAGRRAIRSALVAELGADDPLDGILFDGKTDPQIVRELLAASRPRSEISDAQVAAICARYVDLLGNDLASGVRRPEILPGVNTLLDRLDACDDAVVGLLTGNLAEGARLKLAAAGIAPGRFRVGAYGSDHAERDALPPIAARRAEPLMGRVPTGADIVIIGDTPADMTCGDGVGARALGVATGRYSTAELLEAGGDDAFADFVDPEPVLSAILA